MKSTVHGLAGDELAVLRSLAERGHCVVVFTPEELRGAEPTDVETRLIELGWDVIDTLADP